MSALHHIFLFFYEKPFIPTQEQLTLYTTNSPYKNPPVKRLHEKKNGNAKKTTSIHTNQKKRVRSNQLSQEKPQTNLRWF